MKRSSRGGEGYWRNMRVPPYFRKHETKIKMKKIAKSSSRANTKKKKESKIVDYGAAVYFQRTKVVHEEFKLIGAVTEREEQIEKLESLIREVKEERRDCNDETILETFKLFNQVRQTTIRVIKAIALWQESFTRQIRPQIFESDYIIDKLLIYINFINGTKLRKIFNFQFFRNNPLLLPYPNLKSSSLIKVSPQLGKEIRDFAFPNENDIIASYSILFNCLSEDLYKEKLVSLDQWLIEPWTPRIWISNTNVDKKFFNAEGKPKTASDYAQEAAEAAGAVASTENKKPSRTVNRRKGSGATPPDSRPSTPKSLSSKRSSILVSPTSPPLSPMSPVRRQSTLNKAEGDDSSPAVPFKRRNQLDRKQAQQIKSFTNLDLIDDMLDDIEKEQNQVTEIEKIEKEKEEKEKLEMDEYFNSLEKQFLPKKSKSTLPPLSVPKNYRPTSATSKLMLPALSPSTSAKTNKIVFLSVKAEDSTVIGDDDDGAAGFLSLGTPSSASVKKKGDQSPKSKSSLSSKSGTKTETTTEKSGNKDPLSLVNESNDELDDEEDAEDDDMFTEKESGKKDDETDDIEKAEEGDVINKINSSKSVSKLVRGDSRRISDLTVTFSIHPNDVSPASSRRSSSAAATSMPLTSRISRKRSNATSDSSGSHSSNSTSSTALKKNLSKIRLSTSFVREWYKVRK
jgi:hypothetical protein